MPKGSSVQVQHTNGKHNRNTWYLSLKWMEPAFKTGGGGGRNNPSYFMPLKLG